MTSEAMVFGLVGLIIGVLGNNAVIGAKVASLTVEVREIVRRVTAIETARERERSDGAVYFHRRAGDASSEEDGGR